MMHATNHWGGPFEIQSYHTNEEVHSNSSVEIDRAALLRQQQLTETQQGWLLAPTSKKKEKYVDLGCIMCKQETLKTFSWVILAAFIVVGIPIIIYKTKPKLKEVIVPPDEYTVALHKALLFFEAQKSGKIHKNNLVPWRGNSALHDGSDVKSDLVGGYYHSGDNIKFHYPLAFSITLLSWSVIEYEYKYKAIEEDDHIKGIIKWGTDYLLKTFNSSASTIHQIYSQVGSSHKNSTIPDDHYCWQRPEDMNYPRPVQTAYAAPDLGSEVAAALAAASIVFLDDTDYSEKLLKGAETVYKFATSQGLNRPYSQGNQVIEQFYNSTGYYDEFIWASIWMFYATGNYSYMATFTDPVLAMNANAFSDGQNLKVFSWDNKLPAVDLLLTRTRIFLNPGYPYEDLLRQYYNISAVNMCSYLRQFDVFPYTKGGLIQLNQKGPQPLQYVVNAAFLASLYADYITVSGIPGFYCGPNYIDVATLRNFSASQVNYVLGENPMNMSYVVGYGSNYPRYVHHRGASIPKDNKRYSCTDGWKWRNSHAPNPNTIIGAMVGGPIQNDVFHDVRILSNSTQPTLAGNAGLVAALISLTSSGGTGNDRNIMSLSVPLLLGRSPPPPGMWKP